MKNLLMIVLVVAALTTGSYVQSAPQTQDVYVSPEGKATNEGTSASPIDLASALHGDRARPGATIWLRGGTYHGFFTSHLTGTAEAPITVRSYPHERAVIADNRPDASGATLNIFGAYTIYRDFEVTNLSTARGHTRMFRPMGFEVQAPNTKFINLIVHDTGHGFGFWKEAVDSELYGNIVFFGGTQNNASDLRYGHGIYTQNNTGTKRIYDNIIFDQYGWGIHGYPNPGELRGFDIEGNILFDNGVSSSPDMRLINIMVSGYKPHSAGRVRIAENYTYTSPGAKPLSKFSDANLCLGCSDVNEHDDAEIRDNYFVGGTPVAIIINWHQITFQGNTLYGHAGMVGVYSPKGTSTSQYHWDGNNYLGAGVAGVLFNLNGKSFDFPQWRETTGFDRSGSYVPGSPTGVKVIVRPNQYEKGRANIAIYNWDRKPSVAVNVSGILQPGDAYELRNVQDFFGSPVLSGTYKGEPLQVPMVGNHVSTPAGAAAPPPTLPEFGAFLLSSPLGEPVRSEQSAAPTAPPQQITRTPLPPSRPAADARLDPHVGTFASSSPNGQIAVSVEGDHLIVKMLAEPAQPVYRLVPSGADRFTLAGQPAGIYFEFESRDGVYTAITIYGLPVPPMRLTRVH